jgi:hypothetical protein
MMLIEKIRTLPERRHPEPSEGPPEGWQDNRVDRRSGILPGTARFQLCWRQCRPEAR